MQLALSHYRTLIYSEFELIPETFEDDDDDMHFIKSNQQIVVDDTRSSNFFIIFKVASTGALRQISQQS